MSYCISSWGGVSPYRLSKLFSIQKRCVRLLFGSKTSFDRAEYYETCARARPYSEHIAKRSFALENTKPIFNTEKIMSIHNLYTQHISTELFKILKLHQTISLSSLFQKSSRTCSQTLQVPLHKLDISKHSLVVKGTTIYGTVWLTKYSINALLIKTMSWSLALVNFLTFLHLSQLLRTVSKNFYLKPSIWQHLGVKLSGSPLTAGASHQLR